MACVPLTFSQNEKGVLMEAGDMGEFQYPWMDNDFAIWQKIDQFGGKTGYVGGTITSKTKITVVNRKITRENLDLLTGKRVIAYGTFLLIGEGEGSTKIWQNLTIFVVPDYYEAKLSKK